MTQDLIVLKDPKSPISEIFRTIRTNIQFMDAKQEAKLILITSAYAEEGKSWISSNLAVAFAQAGKRVLLIDADMRKGRQSNIFKVSQKPGLSNYLSNVDDDGNRIINKDITSYIQKTSVKNLYLIASGSVPPNPSELLILPQMTELLDIAKEVCDIVIIDGTPSQLVTDSLILSRIVDFTLIVTAHEETKKEGLKRIITNIENVGGKILGVILNKMPMESREYEQAYYYNSKDKQDKTKYVPKRTAAMPSTFLDKESDDLFKNISVKKTKNSSKEISEDTYKVLKQINEFFNEDKK